MTGTILAAQIEKVATRADGTIMIGLGLQELAPLKAAEIFGLRNKVVAVYISPKETITEAELKQVDSIDVELNGKTQSQRIRNCLYKLWEQDSEGFQVYDTYYKSKTELYITHLKSKING
jgi:hypothetical protein